MTKKTAADATEKGTPLKLKRITEMSCHFTTSLIQLKKRWAWDVKVTSNY